MLFALLLLGVVLALAFSFYLNTYTYWSRRGVPRENPLPVVGNMRGIGTKYHFRDVNKRIYDQFKGKASFAGMHVFFKNTAMILDLDLIKQVLIKDFQYFQDRGVFNNPKDDPLTGHLFSLEGEEWKSMRKMLSPVFTSGKIKQMSEIIVKVGHTLVEAMDKELKTASLDDGEVEIKDLCARYTTDVIGSCAFGLECFSLIDPNSEFRNKGRMIFEKPRHHQLVQAFIFTNAKLARKLGMKVLPDEVTEFFMATVKNTVDYRLKTNVKRNDFVDQLIELRAKDQEAAKKGKGIDLSYGLTLEQMAAQAFVFFIAGFETSSSTMSFCLYELALQQDIQDRVREEINRVLSKGDGEISYDALAEMTYLEQVIAETLRKHPILPHLVRETNRNYKVPDTEFVIEKGNNILIPVHNIHHDPEVYPQPDIFDPSRFNPEVANSRHPMAYLPFGDGPRNCIGLRFGKIQSKIGLAALLHSFKFSPSKQTEIPLVLSNKTFTLSTKNGIHLKVERI
ncbi:probable cytochrome P450 6a14 [Drosophila bipectinata]|uniref:probable cytochrome P450 6a14 n=1 Tax=Drosophila bipectinata TaxID=42026 RepID=UPI001C89E655|nr:probable cytochrome P450 6a14 [Drosophila bipectinata]